MGTVDCGPASTLVSSMLAHRCVGLVVLVLQVQAYPQPVHLQGYRVVAAVPGRVPLQRLSLGPQYFRAPQDTQEVRQAKQEFMAAFDRALSGLLHELAPQPIENSYLEDTQEVIQARAEFMRTFEAALNGVIDAVYLEDTEEVKEEKKKFFKAFDAAMNNLLTTVENVYLEDTPEVKEAKDLFQRAYSDAEAGIVGAQYIEDTPEVKQAKKRFFRFFDFAVNGMLSKLIPVPGNNVLHPEIADFYIKDDADVASAKEEFDELYKQALNGDPAAVLAVAVIEGNGNDLGAAVQDLSDALEEIEFSDNNEEDLEDSLEYDAVILEA